MPPDKDGSSSRALAVPPSGAEEGPPADPARAAEVVDEDDAVITLEVDDDEPDVASAEPGQAAAGPIAAVQVPVAADVSPVAAEPVPVAADAAPIAAVVPTAVAADPISVAAEPVSVAAEPAPVAAAAPVVIETTAASSLELIAAEGAADRIAVLSRELALEGEASRRAVIEHEIAVLEESIRDGGGAEALLRSMRADPTLKPNLWALRRAYKAKGAWAQLVEVIDAELHASPTARERAELHVDRGQIFEDRLADPASARKAYEAALVEDAAFLPALMALERLVIPGGDAAELAGIYRWTASATFEPARKVELLLDLARLTEGEAGGQASQQKALAILREALAVGASTERVIDEIERVAQAAGLVDDLILALDRRAELHRRQAAVDGVEGQRAKDALVAVRRRQAQLVAERDPKQARAFLTQAREVAPDDALVLGDLHELARSEARWDDAASLAASLAEAAQGTVRLRHRLAQRRALLLAEKAEAAAALDPELLAEPSFALMALLEKELGARAGGGPPSTASLASLALLFEAQAALLKKVGDGRAAAGAFTRAGAAHERAGDEAGAITAYLLALDASPSFPPALDGLDPLLARARRYADRAGVLEGKLAQADNTAKVWALEDLLELRLDNLGDVDGALAIGAALCVLRGSSDGEDVAARARLVEIARGAGRYAEAAAHLEPLAARLLGAGSVERGVDALLHRADLIERQLGDPKKAHALVDEALRVAPAHPRAGAEKRRLLAAEGRYEEVAASLRAEASACTDPERTGLLLVELSYVYEVRLKRADDARATIRELSDRVPSHRLSQPILEAELAGDPSALARLFEAGAAAASTEDGRGSLLHRLGEVEEQRLHDGARAAVSYRRALDVGGVAVPHAALGLYRHAARGGDRAPLDRALAAFDDQADEATAGFLLEERASIAADAGVADSLRDQATKRVPGHLPSLLGRARASMRTTGAALESPLVSVVAHAEALSALAQATADARLSAAWKLRAATMALVGSGTAPSTTAAASAIEALPFADGDAAELDELAVVASELVGDPAALARRVARAGSDAGELRLELVEALVARGRLAEAATEAIRALDERPNDLCLLTALLRIARLGGDRLGEARVGARLATAVTSDEKAVTLARDAALALEAAGEGADAASAWRTVLARRPLDEEAFARARGLLTAEGDDAGLEALLGDRLLHAPDRGALLLERCAVRARAGRSGPAAEDFRQACASPTPPSTGALRLLAETFAVAGDRAGAALVLERVADQLTAAPPEERKAVLVEIAEHYEAAADRPSVVRTLRRLVDLRADDPVAIDRLAVALIRAGDPVAAVTQLGVLAALVAGEVERGAVEFRIATVLRYMVKDLPGARLALVRSLDADPINLPVLDELLAVCDEPKEAAIRAAALTQALRQSQRALEADPLRADAYRIVDRVRGLGSDEEAREFSRQALAAIDGVAIPPRAERHVEPSGALPEALVDEVYGAGVRGFPLEVWRAIAEGVPRLFDPDLATLGVTRGDRVNEKGLPPGFAPLDRIAKAVVAGEYALFVGRGADLCHVVGDALVVAPSYGGPLHAGARFRLARKLVLLRDRLGPLETLDDDELGLFFAACARVAGARWSPAVPPLEARLDERAKQLAKVIDRKTKKALQALAPGFADLGGLPEWRRAVLDGANRVGLVLGGDLGAALVDLRVDGKSAAGRSLTRFSVSDALLAMRRAIGLAA